MVKEYIKQLSTNHMCKIGLISKSNKLIFMNLFLQCILSCYSNVESSGADISRINIFALTTNL
jgi:hypothetical protein